MSESELYMGAIVGTRSLLNNTFTVVISIQQSKTVDRKQLNTTARPIAMDNKKANDSNNQE